MSTKDIPPTCPASTVAPSGLVWVCSKDDCDGRGHYYQPSAA